ncbi:hypothetical protein EFU47_17460 [Vibrio cholerae]|nr:hypothetical protein [Vibrio cholerae]
MIIKMLFKFGKREHLEATRSCGQLYFGSFMDFRKNENTEVGDKNEGAHRIVNSANMSLTVFDHSFQPIMNGNLENVMVREFSESSNESRIYCMYRTLVDVSEDVELSKLLDVDLIERFGYESILIIAQVNEFYQRLDNYLSKESFIYKRSCVEYKDLSKGTLEVSPFIKDLRYKPQSEYRICIQKIDGNEPLVINIGSLSDIAQIIDVTQLTKARLITTSN